MVYRYEETARGKKKVFDQDGNEVVFINGHYQRKTRDNIPSAPRDKAGYVYLLEVPNHPGLYKIGRASNPDNRLRTFNVKLPFPVSYAHLIKSNDCYRLERELHQLFSEQRLDGEFFTLSAADVMVIKAMQGD